MSKSTIISKETKFASKFFKVVRVVLERDGKQFTKDIVERRDVVFILPFTDNGDIYMVSQYRDALQKISFEIVAGQMDAEEDPLVAAKRELQEETGLVAQNWQHVRTFHLSANMKGQAHVFVATQLQEGESAPDDDEDLETIKIPFEEVVKKVTEGEIDISTQTAAILLVDTLKREGKI
jgi:8-oxo-dGTP pyrophosphatase MutT (NUDIX family)